MGLRDKKGAPCGFTHIDHGIFSSLAFTLALIVLYVSLSYNYPSTAVYAMVQML